MNTSRLISLPLAMVGALVFTATVAVAQSSTGSTAAGAQKESPPSSVGGASGATGTGTAIGGTRGAPIGAGSAVGGESGSEAGDAVAIRKIALERSKYVKRQAQIDRLRALAREQGNQPRLDALDKLESKLESQHERKMKRWRGRLGDEKFGKIDKRLESKRGKTRGKTMGGGPDRKRPNDPRDRANDSSKVGDSKGKDRGAGGSAVGGDGKGKDRGAGGSAVGGAGQGKGGGADGSAVGGAGQGKGGDAGHERKAGGGQEKKSGSGGGSFGEKKKKKGSDGG